MRKTFVTIFILFKFKSKLHTFLPYHVCLLRLRNFLFFYLLTKLTNQVLMIFYV